jgi:hypothetical protein
MLVEMTKLFFRGKLLEDMRGAVIRVAAVGLAGGVAIGLLFWAGVPLIAAMALAGFAGGFVTTRLLRDVKVG